MYITPSVAVILFYEYSLSAFNFPFRGESLTKTKFCPAKPHSTASASITTNFFLVSFFLELKEVMEQGNEGTEGKDNTRSDARDRLIAPRGIGSRTRRKERTNPKPQIRPLCLDHLLNGKFVHGVDDFLEGHNVFPSRNPPLDSMSLPQSFDIIRIWQNDPVGALDFVIVASGLTQHVE